MKNTSKGFALIEALIAILIIGVIGFVLTDLLLKTFKGNDKTRLVSKVVQNGQVALNNLSQALRDADSLICSSNTTIVVNNKGQLIRFAFSPAAPGVNGYLYKEFLVVTKYPSGPADFPNFCTNTEMVETGDPVNFTVSSTVNLTDKLPSGVSVQGGSFSDIPRSGSFKDAVTIQFQVGPSVSAGSGFENQLGGVVDFKTTVQLK